MARSLVQLLGLVRRPACHPGRHYWTTSHGQGIHSTLPDGLEADVERRSARLAGTIAYGGCGSAYVVAMSRLAYQVTYQGLGRP
jgi:hypothetical protein